MPRSDQELTPRMNEILPVPIVIDVEPDAFDVEPHSAVPWTGFEHALDLFRRFRSRAFRSRDSGEAADRRGSLAGKLAGFRIPRQALRGGVLDRAGRGASSKERCNEVVLQTCRCQVQKGVATVKPVRNALDQHVVGDSMRHQRRIPIQLRLCGLEIAADDGGEERAAALLAGFVRHARRIVSHAGAH